MKTPDEIKKGLKFCHSVGRVLQPESWCENVCPYMDEKYGCGQDYLHEDSLAYIHQLETERHQLLTRCERLEREREAAVADLKYANVRGDCWHCNHANNPERDADCYKADCDCETCQSPCPCAICVDGSNWEWRGVKEE